MRRKLPANVAISPKQFPRWWKKLVAAATAGALTGPKGTISTIAQTMNQTIFARATNC
jgi:hypothetical protein